MIKLEKIPRRLLLEINTQCNLRCKMCFSHSKDSKTSKKLSPNNMPIKTLEKIIEEVKETKPLIHPERYAEVLLSKNFKEGMKIIKNNGLPIAINTNGTLFDEDMCKFFIDIGIESVNFSINAFKESTYKNIHGVDKLAKIRDSIIKLVELRGDSYSPRICVSFVRQDENIDEEEDFIDFWAKYVDVIRISALMSIDDHDDYTFLSVPKKRIPCRMLYETMPIMSNGDVCLCCRDYDGSYILGNVNEESVEDVWHGEGFKRVRKLHEEGRWDEIPICSKCDGWVWLGYDEEVTDRFLIRRSPIETYYNIKERLKGWEDSFLGGHKKPDIK